MEWIDDPHASQSKINRVARGHRELVLLGASGDETIFDRYRATFATQVGQQPGPDTGRGGVYADDIQLLDARLKPVQEQLASSPGRQQQNSVLELAENDRIDNQVFIVPLEPVDHLHFGLRLGGLTQHIGIDEELHSLAAGSEAVDSEGSG